ncbi:MAG: GAF domain-containing protein [Anaerolineae bacterium]|nr:GAF domain-containing protein [Anaerolineae bacterium]
MKFKIPLKTIRSKIIIWSFVPTTIILFTVALVAFFAFQHVTEVLAIERDQALAYVSAREFASKLGYYEEVLETFARTVNISQSDPETQRDVLKQADTLMEVFTAGVIILNASGEIVAMAPEPSDYVDQDFSDQVYYREVVDAWNRGSAAMIVTNIIADNHSAPLRVDPSYFVANAIPILAEQGEFQGVLVGKHPLESMAVYFHESSEILGFGEDGNIYIVDGYGQVIYHTNPAYTGARFEQQEAVQQVLQDKIGAMHTHNIKGESIIAGYTPVPGTPWGLVTEETWETLTRDSQDYQQFLILLLVLGVVIPDLLVNFGVKRITKPITELMAATQEIARGNFNQIASVETGDEIEALANQFNTMAAKLRDSYTTLEQKVADRTRELATLNAISSVVNRSLDMNEILGAALDETLSVLAMDLGNIHLIDSNGTAMTVQVHRGLSKEYLEVIRYLQIGEGIAGKAVAQNRPVALNIRDYPTQRLAPFLIKEKLQTLISTPITYKGRPLGALSLGTRKVRYFPPQELSLLASVGQQIGMGLENARLYAQTEAELAERRRAEASITHRLRYEIGLAACAQTLLIDAPDALRETLHQLRHASDACRVHIFENFEDVKDGFCARQLYEVCTPNVKPELDNPHLRYLPYQAGFQRWQAILSQGRALRGTVAHFPISERQILEAAGIQSLLALPIQVEGQWYGFIGFDNTYEARRWDEEDIRLLQTAAIMIGAYIGRKRADKALQASEAQNRALLEAIPDLILVMDQEGVLLDYKAENRPEMLAHSEFFLGKNIVDITPPEIAQQARTYIKQVLQTGKVHSYEYQLPSQLGDRILSFEVRMSLSGENQVLALIRDVTERKEAEEALLRARDAAETARREAEYNAQAAEAANRAKSVFLANMSHELRTPLNAILGFTQLMARDVALSTEQHENIETINRSGQHLLNLINDVLEMSKIEAGQTLLYEDNFDLHRMLKDLESMFRLRAANKGLTLSFEYMPNIPQYIQTDEGKLRQVLINLLSNAIKFTEVGSVTVRIKTNEELRVKSYEPENIAVEDIPNSQLATHHSLHFEVEDTGVGIAAQDLDKLFDPFVQTPSGQEAKEGTGLGLPISQKFVQLMGGDITVKSHPGQGSIFAFDIQIKPAKADAVAAIIPVEQQKRRVIGLEPGQCAADGRPYRLLVVEDNEINRQLLVKFLTRLGTLPHNDHLDDALLYGGYFEIREAINGQEAIQIWESWDPHLIWMDMRMPVLDGHEATKHIKATTKGQATVIIALTASAFEEDRRMILSEGCDDFIRKPFREQELFQKLEKHLGIRFIYEDIPSLPTEGIEESTFIESVLTGESLAALPVDWVTHLYEATIQADIEIVLELLEQLTDEGRQLATVLTNLVHNFRFDIILEWLKLRIT